MNKQNIKKKPLRGLVRVCAIAALAGALLATTAGVASADYGPGALYQIALSAADLGPEPGHGGGIWLWIALYPDGTGDYTGSDCIAQGGAYGVHGAYPDLGDVTWTYSGNSVVISGVLVVGISVEIGRAFYTTITVPRAYGHYTGTLGTFWTLPPEFPPEVAAGGSSQLQVAH